MNELFNDCIFIACYTSLQFGCVTLCIGLYLTTYNERKSICNRLTNGIKRKKKLTSESGFMEVVFFKQRATEQMLFSVILRFIYNLLSIILNYLSVPFNRDVTMIFKVPVFLTMVTKSGFFLFLRHQCCYSSAFVAIKKTFKTSIEIFFNLTIWHQDQNFRSKSLKTVLKKCRLFFIVYLKKFTFVYLYYLMTRMPIFRIRSKYFLYALRICSDCFRSVILSLILRVKCNFIFRFGTKIKKVIIYNNYHTL
jgi:hypothetical protein